MYRRSSFAMQGAAFMLLAALPPTASPAQTGAAPKTASAFTFCTVTDIVGHTIWASPVFAYDYPADDAMAGFNRTQSLAAEFHAQVSASGGGGDKSCFPGSPSRAELETVLNEQRAQWTKRVLLWKADWNTVAFTPEPWSPGLAAAAAGRQPRYLYCWSSDMDPDVRKSVASPIIAVSMPPMSDPDFGTEMAAYERQFTRDVLVPHGLPDAHPSCILKDSFAEADKSLRDYRKLFGGFNLTWVDAPWRPDAPAASGTAATPPAAQPTVKAKPAADVTKPPVPAGAATAAALSVAPITGTAYAFCHMHGSLAGAYSHSMTPTFQIGNAGNADLARLAVGYRKQYERHRDPTGKMKYAVPGCYANARRLDLELLRANLMHAFAYADRGNAGIRISPVADSWIPSADGAMPSAPPQGPANAFHISCSLLDVVGKSVWQSAAIQLPGHDAADQLQVIQGIPDSFQAYIASSQKPAHTGTASCFSADSKTDIDMALSAMAAQYTQMGYSTQRVDWRPQ